MKKTPLPFLSYLLFASFVVISFSCQEQPKKEAALTAGNDSSTLPPKQAAKKGKGALSFKMDGQLFKTDPQRTKCWSTTNIPLAMLIAKGDGVLISWQMGFTEGQKSYKLDGDSKGTINFTIGGKTYWTRSVTGDNYLNVTVTNIKNQYNVILLSGTFEGVLEDKEGNKVQITEGKFETDSI